MLISIAFLSNRIMEKVLPNSLCSFFAKKLLYPNMEATYMYYVSLVFIIYMCICCYRTIVVQVVYSAVTVHPTVML